MDSFNLCFPTCFTFGREREQDTGALVKRFWRTRRWKRSISPCPMRCTMNG